MTVETVVGMTVVYAIAGKIPPPPLFCCDVFQSVTMYFNPLILNLLKDGRIRQGATASCHSSRRRLQWRPSGKETEQEA